jgi:hypothetical protein
MPTSSELPELDSEQQSRINKMATASRYLSSKGSFENNPIVTEVNLDFGRTMNWIIMDKMMEKPIE